MQVLWTLQRAGVGIQDEGWRQGIPRYPYFPDSLTAQKMNSRIPACVSGNGQINLDAR